MHAVMLSSPNAEQNGNTFRFYPKDNVHHEHTATGTVSLKIWVGVDNIIILKEETEHK